MKVPLSVKIIRFFSVVGAIGSMLFIWYAIWAVDNIPESEFWRGCREGLVSSAANPETGEYGPTEAGALSFDFLVTFIISMLVLFFTYKRSLMGVRTVFTKEILLGFIQGSIPFLSAILLTVTFTNSARNFLSKIDSSNSVLSTPPSASPPR